MKKSICIVSLCLMTVLTVLLSSGTSFYAAVEPYDAAPDKAKLADTGEGSGFDYDGEFFEVPQIRVTTDNGNGVIC